VTDGVITGNYRRWSGGELLCNLGKALSSKVPCLPEIDSSKPAGLLLRGSPVASSCATPLTPDGKSPRGCRVDKRIAVVEPGEPGVTIKRDMMMPGRPLEASRRNDRQRVMFILVR
jgi:hypothetical protein